MAQRCFDLFTEEPEAYAALAEATALWESVCGQDGQPHTSPQGGPMLHEAITMLSAADSSDTLDRLKSLVHQINKQTQLKTRAAKMMQVIYS